MSQLKLPPFGKPLADLQRQGRRPRDAVYIFTGIEAWNRGQNSAHMRGSRTLILPDHNSPWRYFWPVKECDILLNHTSHIESGDIDEIADCLFEHGAKSIVSTKMYAGYFTTFYKKEFTDVLRDQNR